MGAGYDICIRGAGIVGRTLALLLARERLRVALVDPPRRADASPDVRAYAVNPANQVLLERVRGWPAGTATTAVLAMQVQADRHGAVRFSAAEQGVPALNWIVDVPALEAQLAEAVRYQGAIERLDEPVPAPLTVVCEGRASRTRAELGVAWQATSYPQQAVATRLECERPHQQVARQWFTPEGEILAFLPLGGPTGHEVAVVWSVASERAAEIAGWNDAALAAALHQTSGACLGALQIQGARASWPLVMAQATPWVGRVPGRAGESFALAGDAAHAMHPLAGQGLNVGLGDAAELARVLATRERWRPLSDLRLLRRYERARRGEWLRMKLATDNLQLLFGHPAPLAGALRNWGMALFDRCGPIKSRVARLAMGTA
ncbi:MAG TPA: FAD-dependent monooxygenase [Ottowia sp.]|uniref:FAD-dependent monooxygenase n=1 Tax=Ottowia sp. TaxID=1898956 RepID=UPI002B8C6918|nr:FAD-dependent monooxygenase [Ottowia sp.]HMN22504.1 FAD-dependent monooxygenase [Ottowia sp.]